MPKVTGTEPKQKRSIRTKDRIFRVASRIFADKGLAGARIDEIARKARINKQRIYAYFGSKDELYRQVLVDTYAKAAQNERLLGLTEDDIPNLTGLIIDTFFEIHEKNNQFWRMLCWENLNGGKSLREGDWEAIRSSYIQHLSRLYKTGQEQGVFRKNVDFATYIMLLFSTTYFYFSNQLTMSHLLDLKLDQKEVRKRIEDQFLTIMTRGIEEG